MFSELDLLITKIFEPHIPELKECIKKQILEDTVDMVIECVYLVEGENNENRNKIEVHKDKIMKRVLKYVEEKR